MIQDLRANPEKLNTMSNALRYVAESPSMNDLTGTAFDDVPFKAPRVSGAAKLPMIMDVLGVAGDVGFIWGYARDLSKMWSGDFSTVCGNPVYGDMWDGSTFCTGSAPMA